MKRIFVCIMVLVFAMGMLASCGSAEKDDAEVNSDEVSAAKASEEEVSSQQESSESVSQQEQAENDESSQVQIGELSYEIEYADDKTAEEMTDPTLINEYVEKSLELAKVIQLHDNEKARELMNVDLLIKHGWENDYLLSVDDLESDFEVRNIYKYDFSPEIENVKKVRAYKNEEGDLSGILLEICLDKPGKKYTRLASAVLNAEDGTFMWIAFVDEERKPKSEQTEEQTQSSDDSDSTDLGNEDMNSGYDLVISDSTDLGNEDMNSGYDLVISYSRDFTAVISEEQVDEYVDKTLRLTRAIQQKDYKTARELINTELGEKLDWMDDFPEEENENVLAQSHIGDYEFTAELENLKRVVIFPYMSYGFPIMSITLYLGRSGESDIVVTAELADTDEGSCMYIGRVNDGV